MVLDVQQPQPALLAHGECDETAELDQLRLGKMFIQSLPERIIGIQMPGNRFGIGKCCLLPIVVVI